MFLLTAIGLLALASGYIGLRLVPALPLGPTGYALAAAVLCVPLALGTAGAIAWSMAQRRLARALISTGSLTLGWMSSLLLLTLLRELLLAFSAWLAPAADVAAIRTGSAIAVPALSALVTLIGAYAAMGRPRLVEISIPLPELAADLHGFTIVQISDLHVGTTIRRRYVERIVERINRLNADLVAITGDLVDGEVAELAAQVAPLAGLKSRHGTYFVTGNHEYYSGATAWTAELRRLGLHVLLNEHVVIRHGAAALVLAGVIDPAAQAFDAAQRSDPQAALRGAPPLRPRILLAHRPRSAPAAAKAGFDLQLSGHTHGGQFWPWNLVVRLQEPLAIGLDRLNDLWVYTSRGTGFWGPPQRLGVPAEITRLRLGPAPPETGSAQAAPPGQGGTDRARTRHCVPRSSSQR